VSSASPPRRRTWRRKQIRRRRIAIGLGAAGFLLLLALAVELVRVTPMLKELSAGEQTLRDASTALGRSPGDWTAVRIASAQPLQVEALQQISAGQHRLERDPVLTVASHIPIAGDQVRGLVDVANAGISAAQAFADVIAVARSYDAARSDPAPPGDRLLHLIGSSSGPLSDAHSRLQPALKALYADLDRPLLPPVAGKVRNAVSSLEPVDSMAAAGAAAGKYAPDAIGASGPRTYLLLLANPAELRPAGGFVGAVGTLTFNHGSASAITVVDQRAIDQSMQQHFEPPPIASRYLTFFRNSLEIGDAGWDPDFPATARLSEQMYGSATGRQVDGTISIDPYALSALLAVTGAVDVPGYGNFDAANLFPKLDFIVNVSTAPGAGKGALSPIARAVLEKILTQPVSSWPRLLSALQRQASGRHLQLFLHDQRLATATAEFHSDGAVLGGGEDYLMVVDANVGVTKGDYYLRKSMTVKAELPSGGVSRHEVTLDYSLPLPVDATDSALNPGSGEYHDYLRFYLPETATLSGLRFTEDGQPSSDGGAAEPVRFEHGRQVVGTFFRLPRGHRVQLRLAYRVPLLPQNSFDLLIQKQAGTPARPTTVSVSYPGGQASRQADLAEDISFHAAW
jgi:hypothetical protein